MLKYETHSFGAERSPEFPTSRSLPELLAPRPNEITLENTAEGITATFDGPAAEDIFILFGTNVLPVNAPFGCDTMQDVARWIRQQWPGWAVGVV